MIIEPSPVPADEIAVRIRCFRSAMASHGVDALIVTCRANFEYLTGYETLTWAYQARPLYAVLTLSDFIVVASRAEARNMGQQTRAFRAVHYDGLQRESAAAVVQVVSPRGQNMARTVAIDWGQDHFGRGSFEMLDGLRSSPGIEVVSGERLVWSVRMFKTGFEAEMMRRSYAIVNEAFDESIAQAREGISELQLLRLMQGLIVAKGAERVDPIAMLFSKGDFIYNRPAGQRKLERGHYVWTDFRSTVGGYPADRNRIARCGEPTAWEIDAYRAVREVTHELCRGVRPGQTGADVYRRFEVLWTGAGLGAFYGAVSRIGHGGGLEVTEPPSIASWSNEVIESGMVIHIEPKLERDGAVFQFEEVVWVRNDSVEFLSELSPAACPIIATAD